jgi:hypothetical protein
MPRAGCNAFNRDYPNPYLNFHRPCFFPKVIVDAKGKQRKRYPYERMMTPYENLKSLSNAERFFKPGVTFEQLHALALQMSDNEAAAQLHKARQQLFQRIHEQPPQTQAPDVTSYPRRPVLFHPRVPALLPVQAHFRIRKY